MAKMIDNLYWITNFLLSFGIKKLLSRFIKSTQWKICTEKVWTGLFLHLNFVHTVCICRSFPFRCKIYGRRVCASQFTGICPII